MKKRGWTLIELILVSAILGVVGASVSVLWHRTQKFVTSSEALTAVKTATLMDVRRIERELGFCRAFFHGAAGANFLARIDFTSLPPMLSQSRLASADGVNNVTQAISGNTNAGNVLLFLRGLPNLSAAVPGGQVNVTQSQFHLYYLT